MGESAKAVDAAQTNNKELRYGLGKVGWGVWAFISLFNAIVILGETPNVEGLGYVIGVAILAYLWVRFLKIVIQKARAIA